MTHTMPWKQTRKVSFLGDPEKDMSEWKFIGIERFYFFVFTKQKEAREW